jgi:hypothetical protein
MSSDPLGQPHPNYPAAPPVNPQESGPALTPPASIMASFWGWLLAAALMLVGGLMFLGQKQTLVDSLRQSNPNVTESELQQAANISLGVVVVIAVIIAALYAFFAFKLRAGRNWARIVLAVIAVLMLLDLFSQGHSGTVLSDIGGIVAIISGVLSYLPQSSGYIAAVKQSRNR